MSSDSFFSSASDGDDVAVGVSLALENMDDENPLKDHCEPLSRQGTSVSFQCRRFFLAPKGEIKVGELLELMMSFLPAHAPTLFWVSSVSKAWKERGEHLPQWQMLDTHWLWRTGRLSTSIRNSLPTSDSSVAKTRTKFITMRLAAIREEARLRRLRRNRAMQFAGKYCCRSCITCGAVTLALAGLLAMAWGIGTSRLPALTSDVQIAAFDFFMNLIVAFIFGGVVLENISRSTFGGVFKRIRYAAYVAITVAGLLSVIAGQLLTLLAARYADAKAVADTPVYNVLQCPQLPQYAAASGGVIPMRPTVPYFVEVDSDLAQYTFSTFLPRNYSILDSNFRTIVLFSYFLLQGPCCNVGNSSGAFAIWAPPGVANASQIQWPPARDVSSLATNVTFFRTPTSSNYLPATMGQGSQWFKAFNSLWQVEGIPLVDFHAYHEGPQQRLDSVLYALRILAITAGSMYGSALLSYLLPTKCIQGVLAF